MYGNVDYIGCKGHKIAFSGKKKKLLLSACQVWQYSVFCLMQFTFNVKTSSTENVYLHNLHRAALTQKRKCKWALFKLGKNYVGILFRYKNYLKVITLSFTQFRIVVNCVFDKAVVCAWSKRGLLWKISRLMVGYLSQLYSLL